MRLNSLDELCRECQVTLPLIYKAFSPMKSALLHNDNEFKS